MINRPATRIELKLEDDIIEYEEMCEIRRNNTEMNQNIRDSNLEEESSFNSIQNSINLHNQNLIKSNHYVNKNNFNLRNNEEDSHSKSSDISMK